MLGVLSPPLPYILGSRYSGYARSSSSATDRPAGRNELKSPLYSDRYKLNVAAVETSLLNGAFPSSSVMAVTKKNKAGNPKKLPALPPATSG